MRLIYGLTRLGGKEFFLIGGGVPINGGVPISA